MSRLARLATGRGLAVLTLVALVVRLGAALATGAFTPPPTRWQHGYEAGAVAVALAEGRGFADPFMARTGPTAAVGPAVPFAWSLLVRVFGAWSAGAWRGFVALNVVASALTVPALARLARRAAGESVVRVSVAGLAAVAWTLHPVAVLAAGGYPGSSVPFALLVTLALERIVAIEQAGDDVSLHAATRLLASCGAVVGVGLWLEPLLLGFLAAWLVVAIVRRRAAVVAMILGVLVVAAVVVSPWLVRNQVVFGRPLLRSWAGPELWLGAEAGPGDPTPVHLHPSRNSDELARLRLVGETQYVSEKRAAATAAVKAHPGRWLGGVAWRYGNFWLGRLSWWTVSARQPLVRGPLSALRGVAFVVPALLAFAGLVLGWRRHPAACRVLLLLFATYPLTYALTHVEARYRVPIEPAITLAACMALAWRSEALSGRRRASLEE